MGFSAQAATAPTITTQPASKTVTSGASASFSVVATGSPTPSYQWRKGGANISGATSATYTIAATTTASAGTYSVVVTNSAGSKTSNNATLTVNVAPVITTQPANKTVNAGASASFTVVATGTPAPTYQWKKGTTAISGATSATYTIAAAAAGNAGTYSVVVTNSAGTATSTGATLTVTAAVAPTITTQPASKTVNAGASASFTVVSTGTPAPTYQWKKATTAISGATSATYTIAAAATGDAGTYSVVVTNSAGTATSTGATLTVAAAVAPTITTQPASKTVNAGASASFTVVAAGTPAPTYQWKKGTTAISGATSATYTIAAAATGDAGTYSVVVTNSAGTATSTGANLAVTTAVAPTITTQPSSKTVNAGASASFTVVATGTPAPTYQWKKGTSTISGASSATYIIASVATGNAGTYSVVVTNSAGSVTSNNATLVVNRPPAVSITAPPAYSVFDLPTTITVTATASDPDGTVSKVEFYKNSTLAVNKIGEKLTAPYSIDWTVSAPGAISLLAVATDNQNATTASAPVGIQLRPTLPYTADFEATEGYTVGSLDNQLGWVVTAGAAQIVNTTASSGTQSVVLSPGATAARVDQDFGPSTTPPPVVYVDFFSKPVAGADSDNGTLYETDVAQLAFVLYGSSGQFAVYDGDGTGGGTWLNLPLPVTTDANHVATTWQRITLRIDFVAKTWDLFLNGQLLAPDLGFRLDSASALSLFALRGSTTAATGFDDFYVGASSPLFTDTNADGIDDAWETAHGLSLTINQRNLEPDNDGLTNLQEYEHGTDPLKADTDGDGLSDSVELTLGTNPLIAGSYGPALPVSGARLHLRADLGPISDGASRVGRWVNLAAGGGAAVQPNIDEQPIIVANQVNGRPVVRFSGTQMLALTDVLAGANAGEIIAVVKVVDKTQGGYADTNNKLWNFNQNGAGYGKAEAADTDYWHYNTFGLDDADIGLSVPVSLVENYHIFDTASGPYLCAEYFNGQLHNSIPGRAVSFNSQPQLGNGVFVGDFAEIIVFPSVLTEADRNLVGQYLTQKYAPPGIVRPGKPILTAYAVNGTTVDLNWSATNCGGASVVLERQSGAGNFMPIAPSVAGPSYTDTGLTAGSTYSYRVTLTNWAGSSQTSDPVSISTGALAELPRAGLRLWLRSTAGAPASGAVAVWADQSGFHNDAAVDTLDRRPVVVPNQLNGFPVLRFSGANQVLYLPDVMAGATAGEIIAVVKVVDKTHGDFADTNNKLWSFGQGGTGYNKAQASDTVYYHYNTFGLPYANLDSAVPTFCVSDYHILDTVSSPSFCAEYYNGVLQRSLTDQTIAFSSTPDLGSGVFVGDLAEIIAYNQALTPTEREVVSGYLAARYGLSIDDRAAPSPPIGLVSSNRTPTSFVLTWNASTDDVGVVGYDIYRDGELVGSSVETTFRVTNLAPATSYSMMVRAHDAAGNVSAASSPLAVATQADTDAPSVPSSLSVANLSYTSFTLNWEPSTDDVGVTGYEIFSGSSLVGLSTATSFNFTKLAPGTTHFMTVKARDAVGHSSAVSATSNVTTLIDTQAPSAPSALVASVIGGNSFKLSWTGSTDNVAIAGYEIYKDGLSIGKSESPQFSVTGLTVSTTYMMTVVAFDQSGNVSAASARLSVRTILDVIAPDKPTGLAASKILGTSCKLVWNSTTDNVGVVRYDVYRDGALIGSPENPAFDVSGLVPLAAYSLVVKAKDGAGNVSVASDALLVTTADDPGAFPGLRLWLKADSGVNQDASADLSVWADLSSFGNDARQDDANRRPIVVANQSNGHPVIRFNAAQQNFLNLPNLMAAATAGEAFVVVRRSSTGENVGLWGFGLSHGSRYPEGDGGLFDDFATNAWVGTGLAPTVLEGFHLYNVGGDATSWFQSINGTRQLQRSTNTVGFRVDPVIGSGQGFDGPGPNFDGDIAEVLIYGRVLDSAERNAIDIYLNRKYGLGAVFDTVAPTSPGGMSASMITASSFVLQWAASSDAVSVADYEVACDGISMGFTAMTNLTLTGLASESTHELSVRARDTSGNLSPWSSGLSVSTMAPLAAPSGIVVSATSSYSATISWAAAGSNTGVVSYNVLENGAIVGNTTGTSFSLQGLVPTGTYNFTVVAVDAAGNPSPTSSATQVTTPDGVSTGACPSWAIVVLPADFVSVKEYQYQYHYQPAITPEGIACVFKHIGNSYTLYRWRNGNLELLTESSPGGGVVFINRNGAIARQCDRTIDFWAADSTTPRTIRLQSFPGANLTGAGQNSTGARYESTNWTYVEHQYAMLSGLSDDDRVWFTGIESCDVGGTFRREGSQSTSRYADYIVTRSYVTAPGAQSWAALDSVAAKKTWPAFNPFSGYPGVGGEAPGFLVDWVSPEGVPGGYVWSQSGPNGIREWRVGTRAIDQMPLYINANGTVITEFKLIFADSSVLELPFSAFYKWVDNKDQAHGYDPRGQQYLYCQTKVVNDAPITGFVYYRAVPVPDGWTTDLTVPLDTEDCQIGAMTNTSTQEKRTFVAVPAAIAVDANRDGQISFQRQGNFDVTSAEKPFRFWLNDDNDRWMIHKWSIDLSTFTERELDDADVGGDSDKNCNNQVVDSERDLEDLARLWIYTKGLNAAFKSGDLQLGLKWTGVSTGDPAIRLFHAVDADGGNGYLFNSSTASLQVDQAVASGAHGVAVGNVIEGADPVILPQALFTDLTEDKPKTCMLFEGVRAGKGQLKLLILDKNGTVIGEGPGVWMELKEPGDLVERYTCGDVSMGTVGALTHYPQTATFAAPATEDEKDYVLYVHGYNMEDPLKQRWIETAYKRLYWLGYSGRVGGFSWPCSFGLVDQVYFDDSENRAWQAGERLKEHLVNLKNRGFRVHVIGHSQGNIVVGEALRLWKASGQSAPLVRTYIASQAAIAAHCYNADAPLMPQHQEDTPNVYARYWQPGDSSKLAQDWPADNPSYLHSSAVESAAGRWVNFYNPQDYALTAANGGIGSWENDQRMKPDVGYYWSNTFGFYRWAPFDYALEFPQKRYEAFSYAAEARSVALGAHPTGGVFGSNVVDMEAQFGFGKAHLWHSAQFRSFNAARCYYWRALMRACDLTPYDPNHL